MTDVLERLRDDNPVKDGAPPSFEDVWAQIERESGPRHSGTDRARALTWAAIAVVPATLVAAIALLTLGHKPTSVTAGPGSGAALIHYRVHSIYQWNSGAFLYAVTTSDVWVSGSSSHEIVSSEYFSRTGHLMQTRRFESATGAHQTATFSAGSWDPKGRLTEGPARSGGSSCGVFFNPGVLGLLGEFCGAAFRDPAGALERLYDRGEVTLAIRDTGLPRQSLDQLDLSYPGWTVDIFVKHGTFIPVEVIARHGRRSVTARDSESISAVVSEYERLAFTGANRRLLLMGPHPGAAVTCAIGVSAGAASVNYPQPCSTSAPAPLKGPSPLPPFQVVAQTNLTSPGRASSAIGIAEVIRANNRYGIQIAAQRVPPNPPHTMYAVWLAGAKRPLLLGFVSPGVLSNGQLRTAGALPASPRSYRSVLITLEHGVTSRRPGKVVLRGVWPLR